jgi:N-methylhydantoinase B
MAEESRMTQPDAVTVEIIKGALRSAQAECEALLERTAMSPVIREKQDYFIGFYGADGRLVTGTKLALFGDVMRPILDRFPAEDIRPGDIFWYNDCYISRGGVSHTSDQVFATPVFVGDRLVAFAQSWAHFRDIGGAWPGSNTPGTESIFQEGIMVPPVRLYREGVLNTDLFETFVRNSRFPQHARGDTRALTAAVRLGEKRLGELFARFGTETLLGAVEAMIDQSSRVFRRSRRWRRQGQWPLHRALQAGIPGRWLHAGHHGIGPAGPGADQLPDEPDCAQYLLRPVPAAGRARADDE